MKTFLYGLLLIVTVYNGAVRGQSYAWPAFPFDQDHGVNGTFCENRIKGDVLRHHFHDGLDFGLSEGGEVYSVLATQVTSILREGGNAYIRVGRYAYVHVNPDPNLDVGDMVTAYDKVIAVTNYQNHVHFKDGYPGSEINAIRPGGGLTPVTDTYDPTVAYIKFYKNKSTILFNNNKVNGLVDIVARAYDRTNSASSVGTNNGIYRMSWQVFDSTGTRAVTTKKTPYKFDNIPSSDSYITNVYFVGSDQGTYIYTPTNPVSKDGYWDTRLMEKGLYKVKVEVEDTRGNTAARWATVRVTEADDAPPPMPRLSVARGESDGLLQLRWASMDTSDIAGFNLIFSYDGQNWNENPAMSASIAIGDTLFEAENFSRNKAIFFKLRTFDNAALINYSQWSDSYGLRISDNQPQLAIVDGFDGRAGYWRDVRHDFALDYGLALNAMNRGFDTYADDRIERDSLLLDGYPVVLYMTGDDRAPDSALTRGERKAIDRFMRGDGHFIISGTGLYSDALLAGGQTLDFFHTHFANLGGTRIFNADSVYGVAGTALEGFKAAIRDPEGEYLVMDGAAPVPDISLSVLRFNDLQGTSAAVFKDRGKNEPYNNCAVSYLAFPIEMITDRDKRYELVRRLVKMDAVTVLKNLETVPEKFSLGQNYPNPFNPSTEIRFRLPTTAEVELTVYDSSGRRIRTLVKGRYGAGEHISRFDARGLANGVYYYRLEIDGRRSLSRKMLLLK